MLFNQDTSGQSLGNSRPEDLGFFSEDNWQRVPDVPSSGHPWAAGTLGRKRQRWQSEEAAAQSSCGAENGVGEGPGLVQGLLAGAAAHCRVRTDPWELRAEGKCVLWVLHATQPADDTSLSPRDCASCSLRSPASLVVPQTGCCRAAHQGCLRPWHLPVRLSWLVASASLAPVGENLDGYPHILADANLFIYWW